MKHLFRFEVVERHIYEVKAYKAEDIFWNVEQYVEKAALVDTITYNDAEHIVQLDSEES